MTLRLALALSVVFLFGCGDTAAPTQPPGNVLPTPVPGTHGISVRAVWSRLAPPAGSTHAALVSVYVSEIASRAVRLTGVRVYNYAGTGDVVVTGFPYQELSPGESTAFALTLTSTHDIPCADELRLIVSYDNGAQSGGLGPIFDCTTGEWPF